MTKKPQITAYFALIIIITWTIPHGVLQGQTQKRNGLKIERNLGEIIGIALPSAMITYGFISLNDNAIREFDHRVHQSLERNNRYWNTSVDDYMQFAPLVAVYTLKFCNVQGTNNLFDMTIMYGLTTIIAGSIVTTTKTMTARERPDNSNKRSFPSGHTETAFVSATFLHQEFKHKSVGYSIGAYSAAIFVAVARVYKNKHWVSDVVAGAGIGILSTKLVYWAYPHFRNKFDTPNQNFQNSNTFVFPGYSDGNFSLHLSHRF